MFRGSRIVTIKATYFCNTSVSKHKTKCPTCQKAVTLNELLSFRIVKVIFSFASCCRLCLSQCCFVRFTASIYAFGLQPCSTILFSSNWFPNALEFSRPLVTGLRRRVQWCIFPSVKGNGNLNSEDCVMTLHEALQCISVPVEILIQVNAPVCSVLRPRYQGVYRG
jgi:hypothetical protein